MSAQWLDKYIMCFTTAWRLPEKIELEIVCGIVIEIVPNTVYKTIFDIVSNGFPGIVPNINAWNYPKFSLELSPKLT